MIKNTNHLKYIIISGKFPEDQSLHALHNKAFLYWKNFWNNIFKENGTDDTVNADHFWRQDLVTLLMDGDEIAGQHLYSFFHLKSLASKNHSYFVEGFNEEYFVQLNQRKGSTVMSVEYLAVAPDWRKKNCGVSLGTVLIGLACQHQKLHNISVLTAPSRVDVKVDRMVAEHGGEVIVGGLEMHNTPVSLMAIFREKTKVHDDLSISSLIDRLWNERTDYTSVKEKQKIAA
ncbi:MAG: hypothetical protein V4596_05945 [Bdellovibrionota bacterium]